MNSIRSIIGQYQENILLKKIDEEKGEQKTEELKGEYNGTSSGTQTEATKINMSALDMMATINKGTVEGLNLKPKKTKVKADIQNNISCSQNILNFTNIEEKTLEILARLKPERKATLKNEDGGAGQRGWGDPELYAALLVEWNNNGASLVFDEQIGILGYLYAYCYLNGDNQTATQWAILQNSVNNNHGNAYCDMLEQGLADGTIDPNTFDWEQLENQMYMTDGLYHCFKISQGHPDYCVNLTHAQQIEAIKSRIAQMKAEIRTLHLRLQNPNIEPYMVPALNDCIAAFEEQIPMCQKRIAELEGIIPIAVTVQVNNGPAVQ